MNLFGIATREKYRFPYNGMITVEDLWDLSLAQLDKVFKQLARQAKTNEEESLMNQTTDVALSNKLEIVKFIFKMKRDEETDRLLAAERKQKKELYLELAARKEHEDLMQLSADDLKRMAAEL